MPRDASSHRGARHRKEFVGFVQRGAVLKRLSGDEVRVLDNFLRRMSQLGVVSRDLDRGAGTYHFTNLLSRKWLTLGRRTTDRAATP